MMIGRDHEPTASVVHTVQTPLPSPELHNEMAEVN